MLPKINDIIYREEIHMQAYIVRQPIMDANQNVLGYDMLYYDENVTVVTDEEAAANAVSNILTHVSSETMSGDKPAFLNFTWNLLERKVPAMFDKEKLVMIIEDSILIDPTSNERVLAYRKDGYKIAIADFQFLPRYFGILDSIDYIRLNFKFGDYSSYENIVKIAAAFNKKVIAYNIDSQEAYDKAKEIGCHYFQGSFVAEKLPTTIKKTDYLQGNFFMLMVAVTREEVDYDEVSDIISRDVTLTFALLKLVNSAWFALRNKATTVKQALVVLGVNQLKQWIYLLSFKQSDGTMPDELIKLSFLRANFAQELSKLAKGLPISESEAYLLGMFSTLGALTQTSLEEVLKELPISDYIKDALVKHEGRCGLLYDVILAYEKGSWSAMSTAAEKLEIPSDAIGQKYLECVEMVNKIWVGIVKSE